MAKLRGGSQQFGVAEKIEAEDPVPVARSVASQTSFSFVMTAVRLET
jgi:hypothetical protein